MAIQMKRNLETGISLETAYIKIVAVNVLINIKTAYIDSFIYKDKAARDAEMDPVSTRTDSIYSDAFDAFYNLDKMNEQGKNMISMSYDHLKSLPDFAGSIDI